MLKSPVSLLSTHNGPSYLLHVVETLSALGVPQANVRLVPVIGWATGAEVEPYYAQSNLPEQRSIDPGRLFMRLGINVREDKRLQRFLPLVAVGLPFQADAALARAQGEPASESYRRWYARLHQSDPEWTNNETPAERLTRQICLQFPELRDPSMRMESPSDRILVVKAGRWQERLNAFANVRTERQIESAMPTHAAHELVELFLTQAMLAIATADMMGGFEYQLPVEPKGRAIGITITPDSDLRELVQWLRAYPHWPLSESHYPELDERERREWQQYFARHPERDNIFETAPKLWTEEDPGIIALFGDIRKQYNAGRDEPFTSDEMLTLAQRHLADYVPRYPRPVRRHGRHEPGGSPDRPDGMLAGEGAVSGNYAG